MYEVNASGASIVEEHTSLPPPPPTVGSTISGALWSRPDNGESWVGRAVAVGDHGTQVFTEFDTAADRMELISGFDQDPVTPVWDLPVPLVSQDANVDAAEGTGIFVACRQEPVSGTTGPRNVIVTKSDCSNGGQGWTYVFPMTTQGPSRAHISRDGTRIVAGMLDSQMNLRIAVFNSWSNVPVSFSTIPIGPQMRAFLLSADGSTVYFASGTSANVWDVASQTLTGSFILVQALDSHAISGDGRVFAYGGFNTVTIFERQPAGNYTNTYTLNVAGQAVCSRVEISDDSSTLVAGFGLWDTQLGVTITALDIPSKTVTMSDTAYGTGTYQNIVSDISVSANGDRFAVGLWGDQGDVCPELRLYRRNQSAPAALYNFPGSIFDVDMSADGSRVAVAAKAVHANLYAGGGQIAYFAFDDEDFVAVGVPSIGDKVRLGMSGPPNSPARLLVAPAPALVPFNFPAYGTLYLQRTTMFMIPIGYTGATGSAGYLYQIPNDPGLIGTTLCFQGLTTSPRRLTRNWVQMTVLP